MKKKKILEIMNENKECSNNEKDNNETPSTSLSATMSTSITVSPRSTSSTPIIIKQLTRRRVSSSSSSASNSTRYKSTNKLKLSDERDRYLRFQTCVKKM